MIFGFNRSKEKEAEAPGLFARLKAGLTKTRAKLTSGLSNLLLGRKQIDAALLEEIETQLILADVGVEATQQVIQDLTDRLARHALNDGEAVFNALREQLTGMLVAPQLDWPQITQKPHLILMVGINGAGKTTTIGKLAQRLKNEGKTVLLAAGDTFRAAAVEQLQVWGERNGVPVVASQSGADSAAVIFDALQSAKARGIDVVIADTAGRLYTQSHLMEELKKIVRVVKKLDPSAPHDVLLVLDAGIGQNALSQAKLFKEAVGVNGFVLTKLDGTAKGGIVFALSQAHRLPIRFIGVGEKAADLECFDGPLFVDALFSSEEKE